MNEPIKNINPWAEKLEQINVPDADASWKNMHTALDLHMPDKKRKRRKFFFWMIFLSSLIALVFFTDMIYFKEFIQKKNIISDDRTVITKKENDSKNNSPSDSAAINNKNKTQNDKILHDQKTIADKKNADNKNIILKTADSLIESDHKKVFSEKKIENRKEKPGKNKSDSQQTVNSKREESAGSIKAINKKSLSNKTTKIHSKIRNSNSNQKENNKRFINDRIHKTQLVTQTDKKQKNNINSEAQKENFVKEEIINKSDDQSEPQKIEISSSAIRVSKIKMVDTLDDKKFTINSPQKAIEDKTNKTHRGIALAYDIDYAFFFPVGRQQYSDLGPNGINTFLTNFAIIPVIGVYLNRKTYVQVGLELTAPQYTNSLLVLNNKVNSINGSQAVTIQDSAIIRKLYYFSVPVSIHHSFLKNFYVGTGLQFSKLTDGVGMFATKIDSSVNGYHTYIYTSFQNGNLKNTPVYNEIKHSEWRFLFDANYEWKELTFGISYNQAFNNFINTPVHAKNSAALLYVRWNGWKNKAAKKLLSK